MYDPWDTEDYDNSDLSSMEDEKAAVESFIFYSVLSHLRHKNEAQDITDPVGPNWGNHYDPVKAEKMRIYMRRIGWPMIILYYVFEVLCIFAILKCPGFFDMATALSGVYAVLSSIGIGIINYMVLGAIIFNYERESIRLCLECIGIAAGIILTIFAVGQLVFGFPLFQTLAEMPAYLLNAVKAAFA